MPHLYDWLAQHADTLDQSETLSDALLPALAAHGCFRAGVPLALGGMTGEFSDVRDAIKGVASVARHSLTAALVYWGQRSFIEYLLQSANAALCERLLPALLSGELAGATGLSNAVKFLSGMEALSVQGVRQDDAWILDGKLAWISNLRPQRFVAAAAVAPSDGGAPMVAMFASDARGVHRGENLRLIGLRGSHTAAVELESVSISDEDIIATEAPGWLARVRPAFLGMQCGMSIGLAAASLEQAARVAATGRGQLGERIAAAQHTQAALTQALLDGVADGRFVTGAAALFKLRIALADLVQQALSLELQAKGGHTYLTQEEDGFARRWRESAFIPVITPSVTQLQAALAGQ